MFHATRGAKALVSSEHHERLEAVMMRAIRVGETVIERMLASQERHHTRPRNIGAQIDDEMTKVVLFPGPDGAVGQEHERAATRKAPDGVIGVDPGIPAGTGFQFRTGRPQLGRDDGAAGSQIVDEGCHEVMPLI